MYKFLLCWRYLRTRYIALASITSVMLGVATMIVVNAVMSGFAVEMEQRLQGVMSDVIFESMSMEGFPDAEGHMDRIREVIGEENIEGMTPTVVVPAVLCIEPPGFDSPYIEPIQLIGIDAERQNDVGDFKQFLLHPKNREKISFGLHEDGYDANLDQSEVRRPDLENAGWRRRRYLAHLREMQQALDTPGIDLEQPTGNASASEVPQDIFTQLPSPDPFPQQGKRFDMATEQHTGLIMGISLSAFRERHSDSVTGEEYLEERMLAVPGEDVTLGIPTVGMPPKIEDSMFTVVDMYESKMSEFDSSFVFIPLDRLQELRGMVDPESGQRFVTKILINVKDGVDLNQVRDKLRAAFPAHLYTVQTWRDNRSDMLAAVHFERAVLNVLLFLIIAVAGFGILAIFFMIVIEKTKDIGILKSLGASSWGVMQIFLGYGLSLGLLGSGIGMVMGLLFVHYIDTIADFLSWLVGFEVFNPEIYYFYTIPTIVEPFTVAWIMVGAVMIAVMASVFPAVRAARMHPVRALRYE